MNQNKFKIILLLCLMLTLNLKAQTFKNFSLKGNIKGVKEGDIELFDFFGNDPNIKIDKKKVKLVNGNFEFAGKIGYPFCVYLKYYDNQNNSKYISTFFLDFGNQFFSSNIDSLNSLQPKISGSK